MSESATVLEAHGLERSFHSGERKLEVLRGVDIVLETGSIGAVVGPSGSGKSTLLHCLGGLDRPTAGSVQLGGRDLSALGPQELARVRNREIGFVFQFHHLLPDFSALENVMLPMLVAGVGQSAARKAAGSLLSEVGLAERARHAPSELSGGEQQRVAVARALANRPRVVLADEPSGNLDVASSRSLHDLLEHLRATRNQTFLIATHDRELAGRADFILELEEGRLVPSRGERAAPAPRRQEAGC